MAIRLKIKNYRCFTREQPLELRLDKGVVGFLGVNNSGKSTILKLFVEFRHIFQQIASAGSPEFQQALSGAQTFNAQYIYDNQEIFNNYNDGPIEIELKVDIPNSEKAEAGTLQFADMLSITVHRGTNTWSAKVAVSGEPIIDANGKPSVSYSGNNKLHFDGKYHANLSRLVAVANQLVRCLYVGPFRNVINVGHNESYFDIQVGEAFIKQWRAYKTVPKKLIIELFISLKPNLKEFLDLIRSLLTPLMTNGRFNLT